MRRHLHDRRRRRRVRLKRVEPTAFAIAAGLVAIVVVAPWLVDDATLVTAAVHVYAGDLGWVAAPLVLWAAIVRRPARIAVAAVLVALPTARAVPGTLTGGPQPGPGGLRVVTANLLMVHPDPEPMLDELVALDADVYAFEELSGRWADAIARRAALAGYTRFVLPQEDSFGIGVLARVPAEITALDLDGVTMLRVDLAIDGHPARLYAVHTLPPRTAAYAPVWHRQLAALAALVREDPRPVVIAGDLNATRHHPSFRRLLASGLRDAHALVGRASATTWPNGVFALPPARFDHVLVGEGIVAREVREGVGAGSDHRPVTAVLGWAP